MSRRDDSAAGNADEQRGQDVEFALFEVGEAGLRHHLADF